MMISLAIGQPKVVLDVLQRQEVIDMNLSTLFRILKKNARLSRRQACRLGGVLGFILFGLAPFRARHASAGIRRIFKKGEFMNLPVPMLDGDVSLEKAVKERRTVRSFSDKPLVVAQLSQILWAAQGITDDRGLKRAAPSGGALYPIDVYAVVGKNSVRELAQGVYRYNPLHHSIEKILDTDVRKDVAAASLRQMWMATAPVILVLTAEYSRITVKYGERGKRYATIEVGHIGQNVFLQCEVLGLSAGIVGAFYDAQVAKVVNTQENHEPLVIMPVGWKA
jgi:SagB-type dehydrogenase family enzyme